MVTKERAIATADYTRPQRFAPARRCSALHAAYLPGTRRVASIPFVIRHSPRLSRSKTATEDIPSAKFQINSNLQIPNFSAGAGSVFRFGI